MIIDLARQGLVIKEVAVAMTHRKTKRNLVGFCTVDDNFSTSARWLESGFSRITVLTFPEKILAGLVNLQLSSGQFTIPLGENNAFNLPNDPRLPHRKNLSALACSALKETRDGEGKLSARADPGRF